MKKILPLICFLLGNCALQAQENSVFVDSILDLVMSNRLPVFDRNFQKIDNRKIVVARQDTVMTDLWTRPKYIDNLFHAMFDGNVFIYAFVFDTLSNLKNPNYLEFKTTLYDNMGNRQQDTVAFLIDKSILLSRPAFTIPWELITSKHSFWQNEEIRLADTVIQLDSCHLLYRLEFNLDFMFKQYYYPHRTECYTESMKNKIEIDVQDTSLGSSIYYNKLQGHYIDNPTGSWRVEEQELILENKKLMKNITYKIIKLTKDELVLELKEYNYRIKFRKAFQ